MKKFVKKIENLPVFFRHNFVDNNQNLMIFEYSHHFEQDLFFIKSVLTWLIPQGANVATFSNINHKIWIYRISRNVKKLSTTLINTLANAWTKILSINFRWKLPPMVMETIRWCWIASTGIIHFFLCQMAYCPQLDTRRRIIFWLKKINIKISKKILKKLIDRLKPKANGPSRKIIRGNCTIFRLYLRYNKNRMESILK